MLFHVVIVILALLVHIATADRFLENILKQTDILRNTTQARHCAQILAHDYYLTDRHLPQKFTAWLQNHHSEYQIILHFPLRQDDHYHVVDGEKSPYSSRVSNCFVVLVITEDGDRLHDASANFMTTVRYQTWNDKFILWQRDGKIGNTLLHHKSQITKRMLYKLGVVNNKGNDQLVFVTECFYCNEGNDAIINIGKFDEPFFSEKLPDFGMKSVVLSYFFRTLSWKEIIEKVKENHGFRTFLPSSARLISDIASSLNIRNVEIIMAEGGGAEVLGARNPNGSWIGSVDMLMKKKTDIALYPMYTADAIDFVDQMYPNLLVYFGFVTGYPRPVLSWNTAFRPYSKSSWLFIFFMAVIATVQYFSLF